jgi:hypothetical protein
MKSITTMAIAGFAVVFNNAWAAQASPSGYNVFTCENKSVSLDEGHALMTTHAKGTVLTMPNSIDHMAQIECLGTVESLADKTFKASGYCVITDRDGDKFLDRWWADSSMPKGRWEDSGISGKWKGLHRTGSYTYTDRSTQSECKGVSTWEADR